MMQISVTAKNVTVDAGQFEWIRRRLHFALGRFASRIRRASLVFNDINGARGGNDKECRLLIALRPSGEVVVEDVQASVEAAVANVAERGARAIARAVQRMRDDDAGSGPRLRRVQ